MSDFFENDPTPLAAQTSRQSSSGKKLLVLYGSTEGHTYKVAAHIAALAKAQGGAVDLRKAPEQASPLKASYDAVIVGASVHMSQHQTSVARFVQSNVHLLNRLPSAFFSVSLSAAIPEAMHQREAQHYIDTFLAETSWTPALTASFGGALKHSAYDYYKQLVLTLLGTRLGHQTVSARDAEYTDWQAVDAFFSDFWDASLEASPARAGAHGSL